MPIPLLLHGRHHEPVSYQPIGDWLVPWRFRSFEEEYRALRTSVGLIDYSTQALIECRGADRVSFLQPLLTNDLARLAPGTGCQAALLTASAKLVVTLLVVAESDALWLLCDLPRAAIAAQTLERYLFSEQVTLIPHERRWAVLALQGPRTLEVLAALTGRAMALPHAGDHIVIPLDGVPLRFIRHTLTGEAGVVCVVEAAQAEAVWNWLADRGQAHGLERVGWEAFNTARLEAGLPWFGLDLDEQHLLLETGLEATLVSETKGCYLGQEIVARMRTYGSTSKRLMGLLMDGEQLPAAGDPILCNGEPAGMVTSACRSPALGRPIGMGYVKRGVYEPGTAVEILREGRRLKATVVKRPLVPHK